jgi:hypothetical protein
MRRSPLNTSNLPLLFASNQPMADCRNQPVAVSLKPLLALTIFYTVECLILELAHLSYIIHRLARDR